MPAVTRPVTILDLDTCNVWRLADGSADRSTTGDFTTGWVRVHTGYKINHMGTHNFDERIGGRGLPAILKKQNIMTSDVADCSISLDIQAQDTLEITTRDGRHFWQVVMGDPDMRPLTGYQTLYLSPTPAVA